MVVVPVVRDTPLVAVAVTLDILPSVVDLAVRHNPLVAVRLAMGYKAGGRGLAEHNTAVAVAH